MSAMYDLFFRKNEVLMPYSKVESNQRVRDSSLALGIKERETIFFLLPLGILVKAKLLVTPAPLPPRKFTGGTFGMKGRVC